MILCEHCTSYSYYAKTRYPDFLLTSFIGILMMSIALFADAAIGNVQEKNMVSFKPDNTEVVGSSSFVVVSLDHLVSDF